MVCLDVWRVSSLCVWGLVMTIMPESGHWKPIQATQSRLCYLSKWSISCKTVKRSSGWHMAGDTSMGAVIHIAASHHGLPKSLPSGWRRQSAFLKYGYHTQRGFWECQWLKAPWRLSWQWTSSMQWFVTRYLRVTSLQSTCNKHGNSLASVQSHGTANGLRKDEILLALGWVVLFSFCQPATVWHKTFIMRPWQRQVPRSTVTVM